MSGYFESQSKREVSLTNEVSILKARLLETEIKYKNEVEACALLTKRLEILDKEKQELLAERSREKSEVGLSDCKVSVKELQLQLERNSQVMQNNLSLIENRNLITQDMRSVIKAQEEEIERLKVFKNELFEVKRKNLELMRKVSGNTPVGNPAEEARLKQELQAAIESERKWKRQMARNHEEAQKTIEKLAQRTFESERRLKQLASKVQLTEKIVGNFDKLKGRFVKIIKICFRRLEEINDEFVETSRRLAFSIKSWGERRLESLMEAREEFRFLNEKLDEYHGIIAGIGNAGGLDFNETSLPLIYESLELRKRIVAKLQSALAEATETPFDELAIAQSLIHVKSVHFNAEDAQKSTSVTFEVKL